MFFLSLSLSRLTNWPDGFSKQHQIQTFTFVLDVVFVMKRFLFHLQSNSKRTKQIQQKDLAPRFCSSLFSSFFSHCSSSQNRLLLCVCSRKHRTSTPTLFIMMGCFKVCVCVCVCQSPYMQWMWNKWKLDRDKSAIACGCAIHIHSTPFICLPVFPFLSQNSLRDIDKEEDKQQWVILWIASTLLHARKLRTHIIDFFPSLFGQKQMETKDAFSLLLARILRSVYQSAGFLCAI